MVNEYSSCDVNLRAYMFSTDDNATYRTRPSILSGTRSSVRVAFVAPFRRVLEQPKKPVRRSSSPRRNETRGKRNDSGFDRKRKAESAAVENRRAVLPRKLEAITRVSVERRFTLNYVDRITAFDYICRAKRFVTTKKTCTRLKLHRARARVCRTVSFCTV